MTKTHRLVYGISPSPALPAGWLCNETIQLHPIRCRNPREVAVGVCENARVGGTVADLVVEDKDGVTGLGHGERSSKSRSLLPIDGRLPHCSTARVTKGEAAALSWVAVAFCASWVECGRVHPIWVFAFNLLNLVEDRYITLTYF